MYKHILWNNPGFSTSYGESATWMVTILIVSSSTRLYIYIYITKPPLIPLASKFKEKTTKKFNNPFVRHRAMIIPTPIQIAKQDNVLTTKKLRTLLLSQKYGCLRSALVGGLVDGFILSMACRRSIRQRLSSIAERL